jgi:hypothetical protein
VVFRQRVERDLRPFCNWAVVEGERDTTLGSRAMAMRQTEIAHTRHQHGVANGIQD